MYLSIGWSRLMKCDRDIWKIYFACQKCLQNLAIKFSGNLVGFSKCDPYLSYLRLESGGGVLSDYQFLEGKACIEKIRHSLN